MKKGRQSKTIQLPGSLLDELDASREYISMFLMYIKKYKTDFK